MDQIIGNWHTHLNEINGRLELVVIFETKENRNVAIAFKDLQAVVGRIQHDVGKKGSLQDILSPTPRKAN